jgi:hypothetical protein
MANQGGGSECELIKILFKNSAYEPDFTRTPPQASLAKSTQPLECFWTYEQDTTNNHSKYTAETNTTQQLTTKNRSYRFLKPVRPLLWNLASQRAGETGQAGFANRSGRFCPGDPQDTYETQNSPKTPQGPLLFLTRKAIA